MSDDKPARRPRIRKPAPTMREQAEQARNKAEADAQPKKVRATASKVTKPVKSGFRWLGKEYYLPMPENKAGRVLNKRRRFIPRYFRESWAEVRLVTWPSRRESWRLTGAVFVFAIIFGLAVAVVDKGLDAAFKHLILK